MSTAATIASIDRPTMRASSKNGRACAASRSDRRRGEGRFQAFAADATEPVGPSRNWRTMILATSAAGIPSAGLRPIACSVSETQPGETALTRTEIDGSAVIAQHESLDRGVDGGDDRAAGRRILRGETSRQRDRAARPDRLQPVAHDIDLAHQLVGEGERPVLVGQLVPRLETRRSARADDAVEVANAFEQRGKRFRVRNVDPLARIARGADAMLLAERLDNPRSDQASGSDDKYPAHTLSFGFCHKRCGTQPRLQVRSRGRDTGARPATQSLQIQRRTFRQYSA